MQRWDYTLALSQVCALLFKSPPSLYAFLCHWRVSWKQWGALSFWVTSRVTEGTHSLSFWEEASCVLLSFLSPDSLSLTLTVGLEKAGFCISPKDSISLIYGILEAVLAKASPLVRMNEVLAFQVPSPLLSGWAISLHLSLRHSALPMAETEFSQVLVMDDRLKMNKLIPQ